MFHGMVMISTRVCCYDTRVKWNCMLHWHCTAYNIQHTHSLLALNPPTVQWTSSASVNLHQRVNPSVPWFDKSILLGNPGLCWISHGAGAEQPGARPRPVPPQRPLLVRGVRPPGLGRAAGPRRTGGRGWAGPGHDVPAAVPPHPADPAQPPALPRPRQPRLLLRAPAGQVHSLYLASNASAS